MCVTVEATVLNMLLVSLRPSLKLRDQVLMERLIKREAKKNSKEEKWILSSDLVNDSSLN